MKLENKLALITGGNSGIGLATAKALAREGARVAIIDLNIDQLPEIIRETGEGYQDRVTGVVADVRVETEVQSAVAAVVKQYGQIDILMNAAGVSMRQPQPVHEIETAEWHRIIDINLNGTFYCCREVLPIMRQANSGYIINILSTAAFRSLAGNSLYSASKFAVRALTESLIEENRRSGIRITSISPGPVDTNIWSHKAKPVTAAERATMLKPEEIADIVLFLITLPLNVHIDNIVVTPWLR